MPDWNTKSSYDSAYSTPVERWGRPNTRPQIMLGMHWFWKGAGMAGVSVAGLVSPNFPQLIYDTLASHTTPLIGPNGVILLVGGAFNYTGMGLEALPYNLTVVSTETSNYILAQKGETEEAEIRAACLAAGVDPDTDQIRGPTGMVDPLDFLIDGSRATPNVRGKGDILDEDLSTNGSVRAIERRYDQLGVPYPNVILTEEVLNSVPDNIAGLVCDYCANGASTWGSTVVHMLSPASLANHLDFNFKTYAQYRAWLNANGFSNQLILPTVDEPSSGTTAYSGLI